MRALFFVLAALLASSTSAFRTASVSLLSHPNSDDANYVDLDEAFSGLEHIYDVPGTLSRGLSVQALNHPVMSSVFGGVFRQSKSHMTIVLRGIEDAEDISSSVPIYVALDDAISFEAVESKVTNIASHFASTHEGATVVVASEDVDLSGVPSDIAKMIVSAEGVSVSAPETNSLMPALREVEAKLEHRVYKFFDHLMEHGDYFDRNDEVDLAFVTEMTILRKFFDSVEDRAETIAADDAPDMYTFVFTSLEKLSEKYGPESEKVDAATRIVRSTVAKATKLFQHIYKSTAAVELVAVSPSLSAATVAHHFERRAAKNSNPLNAPNAGEGWGTNGFSTDPVVAGYQNCAPSAAICQTVYDNCSNRGVCVSVTKVIANSSNPDVTQRKTSTCFVCDCTFTKVLTDNRTIDTRYKNRYSYTGQMCQYENISEHFHLLFWSTVILLFLAIYVIVGTIYAFEDEDGYAVGSGVKSDAF